MGMIVFYECDLCGKKIHWEEEGIILNNGTKHKPLDETAPTFASYTVHSECARRVIKEIEKRKDTQRP